MLSEAPSDPQVSGRVMQAADTSPRSTHWFCVPFSSSTALLTTNKTKKNFKSTAEQMNLEKNG